MTTFNGLKPGTAYCREFCQIQKDSGMVIAHSITEDIVRSTISDSIVLIASDGTLTEGKVIRGYRNICQSSGKICTG